MRERLRAAFTPLWDGPVSGWAFKFVKQNHWRCDQVNGLDDLMQDAYLVFYKVSHQYPRVVDAKHFMALFKTALRNHMHDNARLMRKKREVLDDVPVDPESLKFLLAEIGDGNLRASIAMAPTRVKKALALIEQYPKLIRRVRAGRRQTLNMRLNQLTGTRRSYDLVAEIKAALS